MGSSRSGILVYLQFKGVQNGSKMGPFGVPIWGPQMVHVPDPEAGRLSLSLLGHRGVEAIWGSPGYPPRWGPEGSNLGSPGVLPSQVVPRGLAMPFPQHQIPFVRPLNMTGLDV